MTAPTARLVAAMLARKGLYICGDSNHPTALVPIWVDRGRAYSMKLDEPLTAHGFLPTFVIYSGPHVAPAFRHPDPDRAALVERIDNAIGLSAKTALSGVDLLELFACLIQAAAALESMHGENVGIAGTSATPRPLGTRTEKSETVESGATDVTARRDGQLIERLRKPLGATQVLGDYLLSPDRADEVCLERREAAAALESTPRGGDDAYRKGYQDAMAFVRSGCNQGTEGKP